MPVQRQSWLFIWYCFLIMLSHLALADQAMIRNYRTARDIFWSQLYPHGGWTLYCGIRFDVRSRTVTVEQVYPASWIATFLDCRTPTQCQDTSGRFNRMEADLHNLYPVLATISRARSNYPFAMIPGETPTVRATCDFEHDTRAKTVEPRPLARGNLARAIFYMHAEYRLPIDLAMVPLLKKWNREDPPSDHERRRNDRIEELQGTRNPFIDHPQQVESLIP